eukprot:2753408-Prymnesium_polylepis.1
MRRGRCQTWVCTRCRGHTGAGESEEKDDVPARKAGARRPVSGHSCACADHRVSVRVGSCELCAHNRACACASSASR